MAESAAKFRPGEIIFCEYEPGDCAYIVKEGRVQISQVHDGKERLLAVLGAGEIFGEMAVIAHTPRSATATALDDVLLYRVQQDNLGAVLAGNAAIARKMLTFIAQRSLAAFHQLRLLSIHDSEVRLAAMLVARLQQLADAGRPLVLPARVEQLAALTGLAAAACAQHLEDWAKRKVIAVRPDGIECRNLNALKSLVTLYQRKHRGNA
jgi:CRP/FNR family transcriptional regulator, cyclic AMP receptor protein